MLSSPGLMLGGGFSFFFFLGFIYFTSIARARMLFESFRMMVVYFIVYFM